MWPLTFLVCLIVILALTLLFYQRKTSHNQLPPGPPGWPIFGNMFQLGSAPHCTLKDLRNKYGDVIWLKLGTVNTTVVLSSKAGTDLFKYHDLSFADRKTSETMRVYDYHKSSLALAHMAHFGRH
ncbi:hypothetical protein Pint_35844 [Pistacia integerrima]|uniref:Uncharacterized protein n=1 Tax=Pistacia integerrima TaxID=434235 RepID=A0ACC0Y125_9ROSI|nr:hypothetical protein Pint_35844 [Pistacia integerrima]